MFENEKLWPLKDIVFIQSSINQPYPYLKRAGQSARSRVRILFSCPRFTGL